MVGRSKLVQLSNPTDVAGSLALRVAPNHQVIVDVVGEFCFFKKRGVFY
jgi:hypothetical protein